MLGAIKAIEVEPCCFVRRHKLFCADQTKARRSSLGAAGIGGISAGCAVTLLLAATFLVHWRQALWRRFGEDAPQKAGAYTALAAARLRLAASATPATSITLDADTVVFELDRQGHPHVLGSGTIGQVRGNLNFGL